MEDPAFDGVESLLDGDLEDDFLLFGLFLAGDDSLLLNLEGELSL